MRPCVALENTDALIRGLLFVLAICTITCDADEDEDTGLICGSHAPLETGYKTVQVDGVDRRFYLRVPDDATDGSNLPMVMAFHGTGGSPEYFIDHSYYNLESVIGNEALLVYPEALPGTDGLPNWIREVTPLLFDEILSDLEGCFDTKRLFLTGHSSGGGEAHDLGCYRGGAVRAVAPVSGILLADNDNCVGEVAVLSVHGNKDVLVPIGGGEPSRNFWVTRNGCSPDSPTEGANCVAYTGCDEDFPVSWCAHDEPADGESGHGHDWPSFASETIWDFFKSLSPLAPSDVSPDREVTTGEITAKFTMHFPDDFVGTPDQAAASLYDPGSVQPLDAAPKELLNMGFDVGDWSPGASVAYEIPLSMDPVEPGNYTFAVVVYMVDATFPIPLPNVDYIGLAEMTVTGSEEEFVFDEPIELELFEPPPAP